MKVICGFFRIIFGFNIGCRLSRMKTWIESGRVDIIPFIWELCRIWMGRCFIEEISLLSLNEGWLKIKWSPTLLKYLQVTLKFLWSENGRYPKILNKISDGSDSISFIINHFPLFLVDCHTRSPFDVTQIISLQIWNVCLYPGVNNESIQQASDQ